MSNQSTFQCQIHVQVQVKFARENGVCFLKFCFYDKNIRGKMVSQKETVKTAIKMSLQAIRMYEWLLDLYVLVRYLLIVSKHLFNFQRY